jgi:hypothetical protein
VSCLIFLSCALRVHNSDSSLSLAARHDTVFEIHVYIVTPEIVHTFEKGSIKIYIKLFKF